MNIRSDWPINKMVLRHIPGSQLPPWPGTWLHQTGEFLHAFPPSVVRNRWLLHTGINGIRVRQRRFKMPPA